MPDTIVVLDFGSQYAQLIARRIREVRVYSELFPWDTPAEMVMALKPKGIILSGGPASVYSPDAPHLPNYILESGLPILGICYGMQVLANTLHGMVKPAKKHEYGHAELITSKTNSILSPGRHQVWMSHGDRIESLPAGFTVIAESENSPIAAMGDQKRAYYGLQFHPEVHHTVGGTEIIRRFVIDVCGANPGWTPASIISQSLASIRSQVGKDGVLSAVSGGVDSAVATSLVHRAVGDQLVAVFVNTGLLRQGEATRIKTVLQDQLCVELVAIEASDQFIAALEGITEPEHKRRIIGELFIRIFEQQARKLGSPSYLVQGTIYPDVVESSAHDRAKVHRIKTHHNVGGLPEEMDFELVEPLRYLFKDEVRHVGEALGLPNDLLWRQPFPGPGLAVRCLGEITPQRLERLRKADAIFTDELTTAGLLNARGKHNDKTKTAQAFAVLLPVRTVGVMGDKRTYQETVALRAVTTEDFMTADWVRLPDDVLAHIANRIVNEVEGINRVVYDITSKPPATIEWE
jgi:GMP synthase (glutamine-hydrolysing)